MKKHLSLLLVLSALGCTRADSPSERRSEALSETHEATGAGPGDTHRIDPSTIPSPPESPRANAPTTPEQARLEELLRAMSEASEQAAAAEGETHCERAYQSSRRFAESLRERMGGEALPPDTPARQAAFVRACGGLPENVQRCMVMGYSVAHQEECATIRREMSDETREGVRALMAELGPLAEAAAEPN